MITSENVKKLFYYVPETGELLWNPREKEAFVATPKRTQQHLANWWNSKSANKTATYYSKSTKYLHVRFDGKDFLAHRIIWLWMTGEWPEVIDHKNRDRCDNRWTNLQNVTRRENMKNKSLGRNNKSGVFGVFYDSRINKWCAQHEKEYLGSFEDFNLACAVKKKRESETGYSMNHGK